MTVRRHGVGCPICGQGIGERRRRKFWMRLIPRSKHYQCDYCLAHYLTVFGRPLRLQMLPQGLFQR